MKIMTTHYSYIRLNVYNYDIAITVRMVVAIVKNTMTNYNTCTYLHTYYQQQIV